MERTLTEAGDLLDCSLASQAKKLGHYGDGDFDTAYCRISAKLAMEIDVATDEKAMNKVERRLAKEGLYIPGRVEVVLRDGSHSIS